MTDLEARRRVTSYTPWARLDPEPRTYDLSLLHPDVRDWIMLAVDHLESAGLLRREGEIVRVLI